MVLAVQKFARTCRYISRLNYVESQACMHRYFEHTLMYAMQTIIHVTPSARYTMASPKKKGR